MGKREADIKFDRIMDKLERDSEEQKLKWEEQNHKWDEALAEIQGRHVRFRSQGGFLRPTGKPADHSQNRHLSDGG